MSAGPAAVLIAGSITIALLLLAAVQTIRVGRRKERQTKELTRRAEQLGVLNRLAFRLARENRRRGVADAGTELLVGELAAGRAVFWRLNKESEPETPWLAFPKEANESKAPPLLPELQRLILAKAAARGNTPLIVRLNSNDQRPTPLDIATAPCRDFVLFLPLRGGSPLEGIVEVYSGAQPWRADRWELLELIAAQFGGALQRARHYEELREQADLDFVTGLFNHRFMQAYLQRLLAAETVRGRSFAVMLMDLDNFKTINDTYGHSVGDRVLQTVADQLKLATDRVGTVGRFGGDEFIVVLPNHSRQEARAFMQAFQDWLSNHTMTTPTGQEVKILASWGLAVFPEDGERRQELLAVADARLYQCKQPAGSAVRRNRRRRDPQVGIFGFLDSLVTSVDKRDRYTRTHSETTAEYAIMLAQELGLSPSAQRTLRLAALLHDVGKICIPDDILRKPGALTADEWSVIRHHSAIVEHLIVDVPDADEVRKIARHHHERFDGSGYPDGLQGEIIPYLARILAVADAYSAITLDRPYRKALPPDDARAELERVAGSQLDPELVEAFGRVLETMSDESFLSAAV